MIRWSAVKAFIVRDLLEVFRSKEVMFWMIAWPIFWVLLSAYVFVPPSTEQPMTLSVGVINYDVGSSSPMSGERFIEILNTTKYKDVKLFKVKIYENETKMIEDIRKGRLDGGFVIPKNFGEDIIIGQAKLRVYIGVRDIRSAQIIGAILRGFVEGMNKAISIRKIEETLKYVPENISEFIRSWGLGIAMPINATFIEVKPKVFISRATIVGWFTIGALGMSMLYSGLSIGSLMVVGEKDRGTLKRLLASPMTSTEMLLGKTLAGLIMLAIMSLLVIIAGYTLCGARIVWNPTKLEHWLVPLLLMVAALITIGLGSLLSLLARSVRGASALSTVLGLMLSFFAGIWFPKWMMPTWMRIFADVFPATWAIDAIREIMVYEAEVGEIIHKVIGSIIAAIIAYGSGIIAYRYLLRKYAEV